MKKVLFLGVVIFLSGCTTTGNLGLVTKSSANPLAVLTEAKSYEEIGPVRGRACRYFILGLVPFGDSTPTKAIDNALSKVNGDAIINTSATTGLYGFIFPYNLFSYSCTTIEGIAVTIQ